MITLILVAILGILGIFAFGFHSMQILYIGLIVVGALVALSYMIYLIVKFAKRYKV